MENSKKAPEDRAAQMEGYEVRWMVVSETKRDGRVFQNEVPVISICMLKPCGRCFECGMASVRRRLKRP